MTRKELKERARKQLENNWGDVILALLIYALIVGVSGSLVIGIVLLGPMMVGEAIYLTKFVRFGDKKIETLFSGFEDFGSNFVLGLLVTIFVALWSLLLVIPGIVMSYAYAACYYIKQAQPDIEALDCIRKSKEVMDGHKWELFVLDLSFIGWSILAALTFGIGYIWLFPYMEVTRANYFVNLLREKGIMEMPVKEDSSEDTIVVDVPENAQNDNE